MPTYLEWDREVLEQCYDVCGRTLACIAILATRRRRPAGTARKFLAMNLAMDRQIAEDAGGLRSGAGTQALVQEALAVVR